MLVELFGIDSHETRSNLKFLGYGIPIIEVAIAVMLLFPKSRKVGIVGALITHLFILVYLIKIDSNSIVYPWNIAMMLFVIILFYKNSVKLNIWIENEWRIRMLNLTALVLFIVLPFFGLFKLWDNYLSFRLYSGNTDLFYVAIAEEEVPKIDKSLHAYFWKAEGLTGGQMISVNKWAIAELNVPFYPETRVFKQLAKPFCKLRIKEELIIFVQFDGSGEEGKFSEFKCADIQ